MDNSNLSPAAAQNMLNEAGRLGAASRAGASWPHVTMLLGMGAISSLSLLSFWLVGQFNESLIWVPLVGMLAWLGVFMATMLRFGTSTKKGFNTRWGIFMAIWAVLWTIDCAVGLNFFLDDLWFFAATAAAIMIATVIGAWTEASK